MVIQKPCQRIPECPCPRVPSFKSPRSLSDASCAPWATITCLFSSVRGTEQQEPAVRNELLSRKGLQCRSHRDWGHLATEKGRTMGAGEQSPASAWGESRPSERALWTDTQTPQMTGEEESDSGHKGKLQIDAWRRAEEEPSRPKESKQVTGLTPGAEAPSLESRAIQH